MPLKALTVTQILSQRLMRPVDPKSRARAAFHVLDWVGCAVAGAQGDAAPRMYKSIDPEGADGSVLYLGSLGNVLEMDDVDKRALLHPGPVIIPATLVAASFSDTSSHTFLDAVVRGYEAVIRLGRALGSTHYQYWHNTGTCGPFGAAAAVASLFDLNKEQLVSALGLAGTQASGFWQTRHESSSQAKQLHTARAAHAGLLAAQLANNDFVGPQTILEGEQGFFAATCGDANAQGVVDFEDDAPWTIHDVSFKPWPACRHAHPAIDAALALREQIKNADEIDTITIRTYRDALVFCDKPNPDTSLSAKFSLQHSVAIALLRGAPSLEDFEGEALQDSTISKLRSKILVEEAGTISARYPAQFGAEIIIQFKNATRASWEQVDALGDPENPVTDDQIISKALMLMAAGGVKGKAANALVDAILDLPNEGANVRDFYQKLRAGVKL